MHNTIKKLYIEPTSRCNLSCVMCFRHTWIQESCGDLELSDFYKVLDDTDALRDTHTIFFGGMGEPLVHPHIFEMIRRGKEQGMQTELITNGTMLSQKVSEQLIASGLDKLWVSVDSFDEESYDKIQVGSRFALITSNIKNFNKLRGGTAVKLGIGVVLMKSNLKQLGKLEDYYRRIEADDINLSHMIPNTKETADETLWQLTERAEAIKTVAHLEQDFSWNSVWDTELEPETNSARFKFLPEDLQRLYGSEPPADLFNDELELMWHGEVLKRTKNRCRFAAEGNCFVRWDGDVSPCMALLHSAQTYIHDQKRIVWHHSFGNIKEKTLSEIWNSREYKEFRGRVIPFEFSPCTACGGCELRDENREDCLGNTEPTCGACLWGQDFIRCP